MKEDKTGRDFYPLTYTLCGMSFLCAVNIQELQWLGRDTGAVPHLFVHSEKKSAHYRAAWKKRKRWKRQNSVRCVIYAFVIRNGGSHAHAEWSFCNIFLVNAPVAFKLSFGLCAVIAHSGSQSSFLEKLENPLWDSTGGKELDSRCSHTYSHTPTVNKVPLASIITMANYTNKHTKCIFH